MDPVGHLTCGLLITQLVTPEPDRWPALLAAAFVSQLPDLDYILGLIKKDRQVPRKLHVISHSIFILMPVGIIFSILFAWFFQMHNRSMLALSVILVLISHLLLDLLTHAKGISILWPLTRRKIACPLFIEPTPFSAGFVCRQGKLSCCLRCYFLNSRSAWIFWLFGIGTVLSLLTGTYAAGIALVSLLLAGLFALICLISRKQATTLIKHFFEKNIPSTVTLLPFGWKPWL